MKIKLGEIVSSIDKLNELMKIKMPFKASYALSRTVKKLIPEVTTYNEQRVALLKELGTLKEDGDTYDLGENFPRFKELLGGILETEIEVDIHKIKPEDLGDALIEPRLVVDFIFE